MVIKEGEASLVKLLARPRDLVDGGDWLVGEGDRFLGGGGDRFLGGGDRFLGAGTSAIEVSPTLSLCTTPRSAAKELSTLMILKSNSNTVKEASTSAQHFRSPSQLR